jgi:signal transduction histidine kinase
MLSWMKKKNTSQSTFTSIIAHDLRTPLSVIKWYTEILLDEDMGSLNEDQKQYLQTIESSNQKAIHLITSLLNVSRLELDTLSISPEPLLFTSVTQEVLKKYESKAKSKNLDIDFLQEGDFYTISFDKQVALYLLSELIHNAIMYSPSNTKLFVRLKGAPSLITYSVEDRGIGIKKEEQEYIGTKMFHGSNTTDETKGSGLGLYIVKMLLKKVGGTFVFSSEEGYGSTFSITIPNIALNAKKGNAQIELS